MNIQDQWGTITIVGLSLAYIIYALAPFNWRFIQNKWSGVIIRFGRVVPDILDEGPVHFWWPFERLVRVPMFDFPISVPLKNLVTAAPNPQNVDITIATVIRFEDPIAVIQSVPDREPTEEFKDFVRAAVRAGVQELSIEELAQKGAGTQLERYIKIALDNEPVLQRWGLKVVSLRIHDINLSLDYMKAQGEVLSAEGTARAVRIKAAAQTDAANTLGQANPRGVGAILTGQRLDTYRDIAKAGGIKTWFQAGGDWLDKFMKDLTGGGS